MHAHVHAPQIAASAGGCECVLALLVGAGAPLIAAERPDRGQSGHRGSGGAKSLSRHRQTALPPTSVNTDVMS
jgi:hypothetical protein